MNYTLTTHAQLRMAERGITDAEVDAVMQNPQQVVAVKKRRKAYQSLLVKNSRIFLLRLVVEDTANPALVVSVYLTTNAIRYWRQQP